jgi:peptide/nickel transport system substrate-binding protein
MKYIVLISVLSVLFYGCQPVDSRKKSPNSHGGTLKLNEPYIFSSLFPHSIKDQVSGQVISQIYEGLVKFDAFDLSVKPAIAKEWKIDQSETIYRFYLNNNIYFHDDACFADGKGRKVTASDFIYTFTLLATANEYNLNFFGTIDNIQGATDHYYKKTKEITGLVAENDTTLVIKLVKPNPLFLYLLASPATAVIPKEAFENYSYKCYIGTGPFYVGHFPAEGEPLILVRNPYYYQKDRNNDFLPYLDSVIISFNSSVVKELSMLRKGELDMVYNLSNENVALYLEKNMDQFKGKKPKYILQLSNYNQESQLQHIMRRDLKGFITNSQNIFDLSKVYFEKAKSDTITSKQ